MIEIRRVVFGPNVQLEYRHYILGVDASGAFCPTNQWSNWKIVEIIDADDAAMEDLITSGGIAGAP